MEWLQSIDSLLNEYGFYKKEETTECISIIYKLTKKECYLKLFSQFKTKYLVLLKNSSSKTIGRIELDNNTLNGYFFLKDPEGSTIVYGNYKNGKKNGRFYKYTDSHTCYIANYNDDILISIEFRYNNQYPILLEVDLSGNLLKASERYMVNSKYYEIGYLYENNRIKKIVDFSNNRTLKEFSENKMIEYDSNGTKIYEGEYLDNIAFHYCRHGKGNYNLNNQRLYDGRFKQNEFDGEGVLFEDGLLYYRGRFLNGIPQEGTIYNSEHTITKIIPISMNSTGSLDQYSQGMRSAILFVKELNKKLTISSYSEEYKVLPAQWWLTQRVREELTNIANKSNLNTIESSSASSTSSTSSRTMEIPLPVLYPVDFISHSLYPTDSGHVISPQAIPYVPKVIDYLKINNDDDYQQLITTKSYRNYKKLELVTCGNDSNRIKLTKSTLLTSIVIHTECFMNLQSLYLSELNVLHSVQIDSHCCTNSNDINMKSFCTFTSLPSLTTLFIGNNCLNNISNVTFQNLPSLHSLTIGNNCFTSCNRVMFNTLEVLTSLTIGTNSFIANPNTDNSCILYELPKLNNFILTGSNSSVFSHFNQVYITNIPNLKIENIKHNGNSIFKYSKNVIIDRADGFSNLLYSATAVNTNHS